MPKNALLNEVPSQSIAQFTSSGKRACIETPDGKVFSYDADRPPGERFVEEKLGFHPGFWLPRINGEQHRFGPAGDYPFTEFEAELELYARQHSGFTLFLMSLDPDLSADERSECAVLATDLLNESAVYDKVSRMMLEIPLPAACVTDNGPTEGKAGELLNAIVAKWRPEGEQEYVVSFRRGKRMSDLPAGDAAELSTYLQALGLRVIEVLPKGESVAIRATASDLHELYGAIAAVCDLVPRTDGTH